MSDGAPVTLRAGDGPRSGRDELAALVADVAVPVRAPVGQVNGVEPVAPRRAQALIDVMRENRPGFAADMDAGPARFGGDASRFDMAIGRHAVSGGYRDPSVIAVMRACREHHRPGDPKLDRTDYWERTLAVLRADAPAVNGHAPASSAARATPAPAAKPTGEPEPTAAGPAPSAPPVLDGFALGAVGWRSFAESTSDDGPACLVDGLIPEGCLGFIAAPPKAGKTWLAQALAVAVATGGRYLNRFNVPRARPVLYLLLEGERGGAVARFSAVARGAGIDPESDQLDGLHMAFRPAGLDLRDPAHTRAIRDHVHQLGAGLVVIDVLRNAAPIPETGEGATQFAQVRQNLDAVRAAGAAVVLVHHFKKPSKDSNASTLSERMTGTGALGGAMDVAMYVTASQDGATRLVVETEARDLPAPEPLDVHLTGDRTGPHGGWGRHDAISVAIGSPLGPGGLRDDKTHAIADYVREHGHAPAKDIKAAVGVGDEALRTRRASLARLGVHYVGVGRASEYVAADTAEEAQARHDAGHAGAQTTLPGPRGNPAVDPAAGTPRHPAAEPTAGSNTSNGGGSDPAVATTPRQAEPRSETPVFPGDPDPADPAPPYGGTPTRGVGDPIPCDRTPDDETAQVDQIAAAFDATEADR